jgi:hypothetical protein
MGLLSLNEPRNVLTPIIKKNKDKIKTAKFLIQIKTIFIVKLQLRKRSNLKVTRGHLRRGGIGKLMRLKLQKQSALKLASRIIPQSGGYDNPQQAAEIVSKVCFGVHTRDLSRPNSYFSERTLIPYNYHK